MKKLLIILLSALSLTAMAQQKKVAVYVIGEDAGINKVLGSKLVSAIARSEEYSAIVRTEFFLAELSKKQNYQRTGTVDDSELSRLGKLIGVQYICVATLSDEFNEKNLSVRLIDVETAQVERTASSRGAFQSLDDIKRAANSVSSELLSSHGKGRQSNLNVESPKAMVQNKKTVAVLDPICRDNSVNLFYQQVVRGAMESAVTASSEYEAYDRSAFDQIQKEQAFQRTGAVNDSQIKKMGEMAGVDYVLVSEVSAYEGYLSTVIKILNVTTGKYDKSRDDVVQLTPEYVKNKCREMAASLFGYVL